MSLFAYVFFVCFFPIFILSLLPQQSPDSDIGVRD